MINLNEKIEKLEKCPCIPDWVSRLQLRERRILERGLIQRQACWLFVDELTEEELLQFRGCGKKTARLIIEERNL